MTECPDREAEDGRLGPCAAATTTSSGIPSGEEGTVERRRHSPADRRAAGGGATVLVVDDDSELRTYVSSVLEWCGYNVVHAPDGRSAVDRLVEENGKVSLLIMDVEMPVMDGRTALRNLRAQGSDVGVLMMSGNADHDLVESLTSEGATAFLPKPFGVVGLLQAVRRLCPQTRADTADTAAAS